MESLQFTRISKISLSIVKDENEFHSHAVKNHDKAKEIWGRGVESRAVGRSENPGVPVLFGWHNLPPLVEIGLTDLPKFGGAMASPAPPGTTGLYLFTMAIPVVEFSRKGYKIRKDFG